jgi:hypothetical protein
MRRRLLISIVAACAVTVAGAAATRDGGGTKAQATPSGVARALHGMSGARTAAATVTVTADPTISSGPEIRAAEQNLDLRRLPAIPANVQPRIELERPRGGSALVATTPETPTVADAPMPSPLLNVAGISFTGAGWPPDTVGDVGTNHYVQAVNVSFAVFDKTTGAMIAGTLKTFNSLWSGAGTGTACDNAHQGDPTVVFDPIGGRYFVADFAWGAGALQDGPYYECIAVSKTSDPVAGGWWLYAIRADDAAHPWLPDYPKMGIWPDGLYMTSNMFDCQTASCSIASYKEVRVWAFNRAQMEAGTVPATIVVDLNNASRDYGLLPSNLRGTPPPANSPNYIVGEIADDPKVIYGYEVFKFHPDYVTPASSTFTGPTNVSQPAYTVDFFGTVPTPSSSLDTLTDQTMMQAQYRNIGGTESVWVTRTIRTSNTSSPWAIDWAQINVTGGTVAAAPVQRGLHNNGNDGLHRWMPSLAVDKDGNMAVGYSVASGAVHPSIRYAGRLAGDALNTLPQTETTLVAGTGSQSGISRWGDYSAMTVDIDGCTFWYTTEYYITTGTSWQTRIGTFKFPNCTGIPTAAIVARFDAARTKGGVAVTWKTDTEADVLGYNVFRNGVKVNRSLIVAKRSGRAAGASYRYLDRAAKAGRIAQYRLQVVSLAGKRTFYGAGSVASR